MEEAALQTTAELPGLPAPQNEQPPETTAQDQSSLLEKIQRAGARVFEKHGVVFRKGRGRPKNDGSPGKGDIPINAPATALPASAAPGAPLPAEPGLDPALVKKCCTAVLKALTGFGDKLLFNRAKRATGDAKFAQQLVVDTTITAAEMDSFSELAEVCLRKYGVGTGYAPEIGLAAIAAGVAMRYTAALKGLEIKKEEETK